MINVIGIVGRTAYGSKLCDGQTIKTRVLVEELQLKYPKVSLKLVDTFNYKRYPLKLLSNLFSCLKESQIVFVLLSRNGMRIIFPILNLLNTIFHRPVFHDCIGGSLDELVKKYGGLKKQLNRFDVNWVESKQLKNRLEVLGVKNVEYLPNFKRLKQLNPSDLVLQNQGPYRLCTFSRVNKAKGIGNAAEAIIKLNKESGNNYIFLDVYGPIEGNYEKELNYYINQSNGTISYKGVVNYAKSVDTLKKYYVLLFPTTFYGEGFPGTLIDAFCAGIPVIATNWHLNGEIICHKKTGFIYDWQDENELEKWIKYAIDNSTEIFNMKLNCLIESKLYSPEVVMDIIHNKIQELVH